MSTKWFLCFLLLFPISALLGIRSAVVENSRLDSYKASLPNYQYTLVDGMLAYDGKTDRSLTELGSSEPEAVTNDFGQTGQKVRYVTGSVAVVSSVPLLANYGTGGRKIYKELSEECAKNRSSVEK